MVIIDVFSVFIGTRHASTSNCKGPGWPPDSLAGIIINSPKVKVQLRMSRTKHYGAIFAGCRIAITSSAPKIAMSL
jgi:hypothetical protein